MKYPLILLLPLFLLTGCAVTRDHVSLMYEPMADVKQIAEAENTTVHVTVNDNRHRKDRVGRKINGYGMPMALIVCDNQVDELVKEALLKELANRGFVSSPHDPHILVNVELNKMSNRFELGFWSGKSRSETNLTIKVQGPDGTPTYSKTIVGEGGEDSVYLAGGKNAKIALEQSLQHAIVQIVEDPEFINALLKNLSNSISTELALESAPSEEN